MYDYLCNDKRYVWKVFMENNKIKAVYLGLLLSLSSLISPCTTSYGLGGEVELCIEDDTQTTPYFLYDGSENDGWMGLFYEGEEYEV